MMSIKEQILQAIDRLPEDTDYRQAAQEIALLEALQEAEGDIKHGRLISNDEMKARLTRWAAK